MESLPHGVSKRGSRYVARTTVYLGSFETVAEAVAAVEEYQRSHPQRQRRSRALPMYVYQSKRTGAGRYFALVRIDGDSTYVGTYESPEAAHAAALEYKARARGRAE